MKANQPSLLDAIESLPGTLFPPDHETTSRGHGRIEYRFTRTAPVPEHIEFPHAAQVIAVEREVAAGC